jgi:tetratricopeptide (TPR) repeat protein
MRQRHSILSLILAITLFGCAHVEQKSEDTGPQSEKSLLEEVSELVGAGKIERAVQLLELHLKKASGLTIDGDETDSDALLGECRELRILYAKLLVQRGQNDQAREVLSLILERDPIHPEALYTLSVLEGSVGNDEQQTELLVKVLEIDPGHPDALASLGGLYLREGKPERAEKCYLEVLKGDDENFVSLLGMGQILMQRRDYRGAETYFDRAIALEPDFPFAHVDRASARKAQGNFAGAIEDLSVAVGIDPDYYWNYIDRGRLLLQIGRREEAEVDFTRAAQINAGYFLAYVYLAGICYEEDRWSEALEHYNRLVRLKGNYHFAYRPLGVLNYGFGNWEESIRYFKQAQEHDPQEYSYLLMAALALKRSGRDETAVEYLRSYLHRIPQASWYYEVARFLIRPEYVSPLLSRINQEKNAVTKKRMSFYIASQYLISGQTAAARAIFIDLTSNEDNSQIESKLAHWEMKKLEEGS